MMKHHLRTAWLRLEIPTWLVALTIYSSWTLLTLHFHSLPLWLIMLTGPVIMAWHSSLQHEATHDHPISPETATIIATPPLALWMPFAIFKESHLHHHRKEHVTDPFEDPESCYLDEREWQQLPWLYQRLILINQMLPGRLVLGPALTFIRFLASEALLLIKGDHHHLRIWLWHALLCIPVLFWVTQICAIPLWQYVMLFIYPGTSLLLLRSFYEHRYDSNENARSVIVESNLFFRMLFLNNNLHVVHHANPDIPWYMLPREYARHRAAYTKATKGFVFKGYGEWVKRFSLRPVFHPVHPLFSSTQNRDEAVLGATVAPEHITGYEEQRSNQRPL